MGSGTISLQLPETRWGEWQEVPAECWFPNLEEITKKKFFFPIIYEALPLSVPSAEAVWLRQGSWRLGNGAWLNHPEVLRDLPSPPLPRSQSPQ